MAASPNTSLWYGKLETKRNASVVIRDDSLPQALAGRLYLYNVERDQIVEYVEEIVGSKLRELTQEEIDALDSDLNKRFTAARKEFMKTHDNRSKVLNLREEEAGAKPAAEKADLDELDEVSDVEADMEDDIDSDVWEDDEEMSA
ncbi:hypothetical protein Q4485_04965 [Granulosicoccaceae sp. 1_MG-2023]|nr:hypothetical protein [Granulosicoccaceae sp. 1_MG-2023]